MAKICFFGGTFDPIHNGHLELALKAVSQFSFDSFFFMPTGGSYLKNGTTSADVRYEMTKIAIKKYESFNVTDIESSTPGPSYTFETLSKIHDIYANDYIYFLMGEDSIRYIDKWKHPEIIFSKAHIIVARRIGNNYKEADTRDLMDVIDTLKCKYKANINIMDFDNPISSTIVRQALKDCDKNIALQYIDEELYNYIINNHVYS